MTTALWWTLQNAASGALLAAVVALACLAARRRPAVQHALWLVVLVKLLTPPVVRWPWTLPGAAVPGAARAGPDEARAGAVALHGPLAPFVAGSSLLEETPDRAADGVPRFEPDEAPPRQSMPDASQAPGDASQGILAALFAVWTAGSAWTLLVQARRLRRHASIVRRSRSAPPHVVEAVSRTAAAMGVRPLVVQVAPGIPSPFVWCLGGLRLLWPERLTSEAELARCSAVIAHELAHVHRRDHWVAWLELAAAIVWWWNPVLWLVRRRLREASEMACDALALGAARCDRRTYAEMFLFLSSNVKPGGPAPALGMGACADRSFERRLSMIFSDRVSGKVSIPGVVAAVLLALLALPGWSLDGPQDAKKPKGPLPGAGSAPQVDPFAGQRPGDDAQERPAEGEAAPVAPREVDDLLRALLPSTCVRAVHDASALDWKSCVGCHVPIGGPNAAAKPKEAPRRLEAEARLARMEATLDMIMSAIAGLEHRQQAGENEWKNKRDTRRGAEGGTAADPNAALTGQVSVGRLGTGAEPQHLDVVRLLVAYVEASGERKLAESRLARLRSQGGAASAVEIEEESIRVESAAMKLNMLSAVIKDAIEEAEAEREAAITDLKRAKELQDRGIATELQINAAESRVRAADSARRRLRSVFGGREGTEGKPATRSEGRVR